MPSDQPSFWQRFTNTFAERARSSGGSLAAVTANMLSTAPWQAALPAGGSAGVGVGAAAAAAAGSDPPGGAVWVDDAPLPHAAASAIHAIRHEPAFVIAAQHRTIRACPRGGRDRSSRRVRMRAHIAAILGALACAAVASADPEAKRLFDEGRALLDRGRVPEACKRFARSLERERAAGTMLNLGACAEREGQLARAWALYDEAAREYERSGKPAAMKFARDRAARLEPRLATVIVRVAGSAPDGLVVRVAGEPVPPGDANARFHDPGALTVTARAPGRARFQTTVRGVAGARVVVEVPALALAAAGDPGAPGAGEPPERGGGPWRPLLLTSLGVAVAGGGVLFYGYREVEDAERKLCPPAPFGCGTVPAGERQRYIDQGSRGRTLTYVGGGLIAAGVIAGGISAYLAFGRGGRTDPPAARGTASAVGPVTTPVIAPVLTPSAIGVAIGAGF